MITIKLHNWNKGRNEPTFRPFLFAQKLFNEVGIQFTEGDNYDYIFVGMYDFIDRKVPLDESIAKGVKAIKPFGDKCFLFDGSDSTSLLGAYEVLSNSSARYLFKNQLLKSRELYREPSPFNKVFFTGDSDFEVGYDISDKDWNRIKLSGYNLGYLLPDYRVHYKEAEDKPFDVCAIYQGYHDENYDHGFRNDTYYTEHRAGAWNILNELEHWDVLTEKLPKQEYIDKMRKSKVALSPFGMGEVCFRDFELMQFGTAMVKPSMSHLETIPNPYIEGKTYFPTAHTWDDLTKVLSEVIDDPVAQNEVVHNFRKVFLEEYTLEKFVLYWYNIIKEQPEVV